MLSQVTISSCSSLLPEVPPRLSFRKVRKSVVAPGGAIVQVKSLKSGRERLSPSVMMPCCKNRRSISMVLCVPVKCTF